MTTTAAAADPVDDAGEDVGQASSEQANSEPQGGTGDVTVGNGIEDGDGPTATSRPVVSTRTRGRFTFIRPVVTRASDLDTDTGDSGGGGGASIEFADQSAGVAAAAGEEDESGGGGAAGVGVALFVIAMLLLAIAYVAYRRNQDERQADPNSKLVVDTFGFKTLAGYGVFAGDDKVRARFRIWAGRWFFLPSNPSPAVVCDLLFFIATAAVLLKRRMIYYHDVILGFIACADALPSVRGHHLCHQSDVPLAGRYLEHVRQAA